MLVLPIPSPSLTFTLTYIDWLEEPSNEHRYADIAAPAGILALCRSLPSVDGSARWSQAQNVLDNSPHHSALDDNTDCLDRPPPDSNL